MSHVDTKFTSLCLGPVVGAHHGRPVPARALPRVHRGALHGVPAARRPQALPRHAAQHLQRGEERGRLGTPE